MKLPKGISLMFVMLLAVAPSALLAGTNRWTRLGPDGAVVIQIVTNPAADAGAYVVTNGAGIFKTSNAGESWRPVNEGLPVTLVTALLIVPDDPATLYAASGSAIFVSTDAAEHWSLRGSVASRSIRSLAFDTVSRTIFAATYAQDGVFRSLDGGNTWEQAATGFPDCSDISSLAVSLDGTAYAVGCKTLSRSSDRGATWTLVQGSPAADIVAVAPDSPTIYIAATTTASAVSASSDAGKTWQALPSIGSSVIVNSVVPVGGHRIYASTDHGVYAYDDGSHAWTATGSAISDIHSLAISASSPRRFYAAKSFGLVTSVENASDWTAADHGLPAYATDVAVVQSEPAVVYAATLPGLFKTENNGQNWQQIESGTTHIELSPGSRDTLYATGPGVVKTIDGGATWKRVNPDIASVLAVAPSDSATVYAALSQGLSKSTDGGNSWTSISAGIPFGAYYSFYNPFTTSAVAVDPGDASRVYVALTYGGIHNTVNGGSTWAAISHRTALALAIDPSAPSVIYAGLSGGGVMKSINGGVTWVDDGLSGETIQTLVIDPANSSVIYAGTPSGTLHRSMNGGADWSFFDIGLPRASILKLSMNASGKQLYAATTGGLFGFEWDDTYLQSAVKYKVSLLTYNKNFVSANHCGNSNVNSNAVSAGPCETFTLYDLNGGALMSGDHVYLQAANGSFVVAEKGGSNGCGGCASPLNANRAVAASWETFTIHKMKGPGQISEGDAVTLQSSWGNYVTAENGGANACGCDSPVDATRVVAREWETFVISIR